MHCQNKFLKTILNKKGWILCYPFFFFMLITFTFNNSYAQIKYFTPKTYSFSISYGISYLNSNDNYSSLMVNSDDIYVTNKHFNFFNLNIKTNTIPYISLDGLLLYSLGFQFSTNYFYEESTFKYFRYSLNLSTYESFLKEVTVHPIIGLSYIQIGLNRNYSNKIINSINLNLGGGFNTRIKIFENENYCLNLLQSINLLYSIMLKKLTNTSSRDNTSSFEIRFSVTFEKQKMEN